MTDVVIFGRSLFIDDVDVPLLMSKYDTIGFNHFGECFDVDYLFMYDRWFDHGNHKKIFYPDHMTKSLPKEMPTCAEKFRPIRQDTPLVKKIEKDGTMCLPFHLFTPSAGLGWAVLQGYKRAYLIGIDHVEADSTFKHHDGRDTKSALSPEVHRKFKQFVYACSRHIKIYQTNPKVKADWQLPFVEVETLYDNP